MESICGYRICLSQIFLSFAGKSADYYTAPTDGACHDESCLCYNQLGAWEMSLSVIITVLGITITAILMFVNFTLRSNK